MKSFVHDSSNAADWLLRIAVVLHAAGLAVTLFSGAGSGIGGVALMEWGVPHDPIFLTERIASLVLVVLAVSLLFYPTVPAMTLISLAILAEAYATYRFGGEWYSEYTLFTHAPRFLMPIALLMLLRFRRSQQDTRLTLVPSVWILRATLSVLFFIHGLEALWHNPRFIDLIIGSMYRVFGMGVSESSSKIVLTVIGIADIVVAVLVLVRPGRKVLYWMCFWGLLTALSRPLAMGFASYPDVLIRAAHYLAPIALWLLIRYTRQQSVAQVKYETMGY